MLHKVESRNIQTDIPLDTHRERTGDSVWRIVCKNTKLRFPASVV